MSNFKKKLNLPLLIFIIISFIILPVTAFPLLIKIDQIERFTFVLAGYFGAATQIVSLSLKEARVWRLRLFEYADNEKYYVGKWINIIVLSVSILFFCYGIYYMFFGWRLDT